MSGLWDPLHLWPLTKGFVMPFILPILGIIYGVNTVEGRSSLEIINRLKSIFAAPIIAVGFLAYEYLYRTKIDDVLYEEPIAALSLMILFIFGLFSS